MTLALECFEQVELVSWGRGWGWGVVLVSPLRCLDEKLFRRDEEKLRRKPQIALGINLHLPGRGL